MRSTTWQAWCGIVVSVLVLTGCRPTPPEPRWTYSGLAPADRTFQELPPGAVHAIPLRLAEASYLSVTLEQVAVDLELTLRGPRGEELARVDGPAGANTGEFMAVRTRVGGPHRLEVRSPSGRGGAYVLELSALRGFEEGDEVRVQGWRELQAGHHASKARVTRKHFEAALECFRQSPDPIGEAYTLQQLGWMADDSEGPTGALERYDDALARLSGVSAPGTRAGLLADRASALASLGRLAEARTQYEQAIDLWRQVGDERNLTETLNSLGPLLIDVGELAQARVLLTEVLNRRRSQGDRLGEAFTLSNLGKIYSGQGEYSRALEAYEKALEIARQEQHAELQYRAAINSGAVLRELAEPQAALRWFDRALELEPRAPPQDLARLLRSHLGLAHVDLGHPEAAVPFFEQAFELAATPSQTARTLLSWGWTEDDRGHPEVALDLYRRGLEALAGAPSPGGTPRALLQMARARALRRLGRLTEAHAAVERAVAEIPALPPEDQIDVLLEAGEIARLQSRWEDSDSSLMQALERSRQLGLSSREAVALVRLGRLARAHGRLDEARQRLEQGLEIHESLRAQVDSVDLRASYLAQRLSGYEAYLDLLVEMHRREPEKHWLSSAFAASERMRARSLAEKLAAGPSQATENLPPALLERRRRAVEHLQRVQRRLLEAGGEEDRAELEHWQQELERIQWQVRSSVGSPELAVAEPTTVQRVQSLLPAGAVLLEYAAGPERSFLFVVTPTAVELRILPPEGAMDRQVEDLVESLRKPSRRFRGRRLELARDLYRMLIHPVEELLEDAEHVLVVPTGTLHYLPFEVLWDGREYLVARWAISYAPSAAVLEHLHRPTSRGTEGPAFLAFADPELPTGIAESAARADGSVAVRGGLVTAVRRGEFRRLPGARREVEAIAEIFSRDEVRLYMGTEATETRLKTAPEVRRARWLHIASHGILEGRAGFSSLLLARAFESPDDGLLQVHEIDDLELTADLVVLSACETGLGPRFRGEGLVGLSRAFLTAGARKLVVSLWRVEDQSTADLMSAFYRRLDRGEAPVQALRGAKLDLLTGGHPWQDPYHWAPFVLIGGG